MLAFSATLSGVFSLAFTAPQQSGSAETVFCPLTKRFQPVHPPKNNLLDDLCASAFEKETFSKAVIEQLTVELNNFNENSLEDLVFDYWQNGKAAFENLPFQPSHPEKTFAKNSFSNAGFANKFEHQIIRKTVNKFSFQLHQRPPPIQNNSKFEFRKVSELKKISRNINPRSPPVFS